MKGLRNIRTGQALIVIMLIVVLIRLIFFFAIFKPRYEQMNWGWDDNYDEVAENYVNGYGWVIKPGLTPTLVKPPMYPILLIALYSVTGPLNLDDMNDRFILAVVQSVIQALLCIFLYLITFRITKDKLFALLVPLLFALYPQSWLSSSLAHTESLYFLLMGLFVWMGIRLFDQPDVKNALGAGLTLGILTLCRPVTLLFPVVLGMYLLFKYRVRGVILGFCLLLTFFASIAPWTIRNYLVSGNFVLLVQAQPDVIDGEELGRRSETDLVSEKFGILMKDPVAYATDLVRKMGTFWYRGYKESTTLFHLLTQVPLLFLGILGFLSAWKRRFPVIFFLLLIGYSNIIHAVLGDEGSRARYSFPIMPYVILFAAFFVYIQILERREAGAESPARPR